MDRRRGRQGDGSDRTVAIVLGVTVAVIVIGLGLGLGLGFGLSNDHHPTPTPTPTPTPGMPVPSPTPHPAPSPPPTPAPATPPPSFAPAPNYIPAPNPSPSPSPSPTPHPSPSPHPTPTPTSPTPVPPAPTPPPSPPPTPPMRGLFAAEYIFSPGTDEGSVCMANRFGTRNGHIQSRNVSYPGLSMPWNFTYTTTSSCNDGLTTLAYQVTISNATALINQGLIFRFILTGASSALSSSQMNFNMYGQTSRSDAGPSVSCTGGSTNPLFRSGGVIEKSNARNTVLQFYVHPDCIQNGLAIWIGTDDGPFRVDSNAGYDLLIQSVY